MRVDRQRQERRVRRDDQVARQSALEREITKGEKSALLARWRFGRGLLAEREAHGGKQLPHGRLDEVAEAVGRSRSEIEYRIEFAANYPTEAEVSNAVGHLQSWRDVIESLCQASLARNRQPEIRPRIAIT